MISRSSCSATPKVQLNVAAGDVAAILLPCWRFEHVQCLVTLGMCILTDPSSGNGICFPLPLRSSIAALVARTAKLLPLTFSCQHSRLICHTRPRLQVIYSAYLSPTLLGFLVVAKLCKTQRSIGLVSGYLMCSLFCNS